MLRALVRPLEWWCLGSRGSGHGGPEASKFVNRHLFPYIHIHSNHIFSSFQYQKIPTLLEEIWSLWCNLQSSLRKKEDYLQMWLKEHSKKLKRIFVICKVAATLSTDHNVAVEEVRKEVKVIFDAYLKRKLAWIFSL